MLNLHKLKKTTSVWVWWVLLTSNSSNQTPICKTSIKCTILTLLATLSSSLNLSSLLSNIRINNRNNHITLNSSSSPLATFLQTLKTYLGSLRLELSRTPAISTTLPVAFKRTPSLREEQPSKMKLCRTSSITSMEATRLSSNRGLSNSSSSKILLARILYSI